ncbi:MAG: DUF2155 domain-containing protein [Pseudomonadota bacterium]
MKFHNGIAALISVFFLAASAGLAYAEGDDDWWTDNGAKLIAGEDYAEGRVAQLRALDKLTARVETLDVRAGEPLSFGTLTILMRTCKSSLPVERPETAAYVDVVDYKTSTRETVPLFSGWMLASTPGVNALEHPVYDVWVISCNTSEPFETAGIE